MPGNSTPMYMIDPTYLEFLCSNVIPSENKLMHTVGHKYTFMKVFPTLIKSAVSNNDVS